MLVWTSILIIFIGLVEGDKLSCLSCIGVTSPEKCRTVEECGANQACYIDVYITSLGAIRYDLGCKDSQQCSISPNVVIGKRRSNSLETCSECCSTRLCNSGGCGYTGLNLTDSGPVCYSCSSASKADSCNTFAVCAPGEQCLNLLNTATSVTIGRKSLDQSVTASGNCKIRCCDSYLCNNGCGNSTSISPSTTQQPSVIVTLTTNTQQPSTTITMTTPQNNIDPCLSNPCFNGACSKYMDTYRCVCDVGFHGRNCEISHQLDGCSSKPCLHGNCINDQQGHMCVCYAGFTGKDCDAEIDHCLSNPCYYGSCSSDPSGYRCLCETGYTGPTCDNVVDHCAVNPCHNGNCSNSIHGYHCACNPGFRGTTCDIGDGCVYDGLVYEQNDVWEVGCDYTCTCIDKSLGYYKCKDRCRSNVTIPSGCKLEPVVGECCGNLNCNTTTVTDGCVYDGIVHAEGDRWKDGCSYKCTCEDGYIGFYRCTQLCLTWNLPSVCQMKAPDPGYCCPEPDCPPSVIAQYPAGYIKE